MSDADLSKSLALALGWPHARQRFSTDIAEVSELGSLWRPFDYRAPDIVLPLIEWLGSEYRKFFWYCSPTSLAGPRWSCSGGGIIAPTLAEAVARACIAVKGGG